MAWNGTCSTGSLLDGFLFLLFEVRNRMLTNRRIVVLGVAVATVGYQAGKANIRFGICSPSSSISTGGDSRCAIVRVS